MYSLVQQAIRDLEILTRLSFHLVIELQSERSPCFLSLFITPPVCKCSSTAARCVTRETSWRA